MGAMNRNLFRWVQFLSPWHTPVIGMGLGFAYGIGERLLDIHNRGDSRTLVAFENITEFLLPVMLGATVGLLINNVCRQSRLNRSLSTQNAKLQRQFFAQMLSAHILHEIRNPLHNLAAVLEDRQRQLPNEETAMLQRNLSRLKLVAEQLSHWHTLDESIDLHEPTRLRPWLEEFLTDKVRPQLARLDVAIEHRLEPLMVQMHPLLLEQCLVTLLHNAVEATSRGNPPRSIVLSARMSPDQDSQVELEIRNSGARYPDAVLHAQGSKPIERPSGLGLGLVLVRRALEQVGGTLRLANQNGQACTTVWIPGKPR